MLHTTDRLLRASQRSKQVTVSRTILTRRQNLFNALIFRAEAAEYEREQIEFDVRDFPDNGAAIELLSARRVFSRAWFERRPPVKWTMSCGQRTAGETMDIICHLPPSLPPGRPV